jgi:hypothetical protein
MIDAAKEIGGNSMIPIIKVRRGEAGIKEEADKTEEKSRVNRNSPASGGIEFRSANPFRDSAGRSHSPSHWGGTAGYSSIVNQLLHAVRSFTGTKQTPSLGRGLCLLRGIADAQFRLEVSLFPVILFGSRMERDIQGTVRGAAAKVGHGRHL